MNQESAKKDFYDKLSSLSGIFIAVAGFLATLFYNMHQTALQKMKTESDIKAANIEMLEKGMKYIASSKPEERDVGYFVIEQAGFDTLALNLIKSHQDTAGRKLIETIAANPSKKLNKEANAALRSLIYKSQTDSCTFSGFIYYKNKAIINVEIIYEENIVAKSDKNGYFKIKLKKDRPETERILLQFKKNELESTLNVFMRDNNKIKVEMKLL